MKLTGSNGSKEEERDRDIALQISLMKVAITYN